MELRAPRVNDKRVVDGQRQRFTSRILIFDVPRAHS
jgi:hypothetical protein